MLAQRLSHEAEVSSLGRLHFRPVVASIGVSGARVQTTAKAGVAVLRLVFHETG